MNSITTEPIHNLIKKLPRKTHPSSSQSDQFQLQYHQIKKLGLQVNKKKLRVGNWSSYQNDVYLRFLIDNRSDFTSEAQRRKKKVFYRLSKILRKRTPDQCRSHHQKLQMKFDDKIDKIIECMKLKLERRQCKKSQIKEKKPGISEQKTDLIKNTNETDVQDQFKGEDASFYKWTKGRQNVLSLQIIIDKITMWS